MVSFWRRPPPGGAVLVLFAAVLTFVAATVLPRLFPPNTVTVNVDMKASLGSQIHLYINDLSRPPLVLAIVEGQRHTYTFSGLPAEDIKLFRLDPVDAVPADVDLYSVDIRDSRGIVRHFAGADFGSWQNFNEKVLPMQDGAYHFTCITVPSVMYAGGHIPLRRTAPVLVNEFFAAIQSPDLPNDIWALGLVLFVACAFCDRERVLHLPLAAAILAASFLAMSATLRSVHSLDPVNLAVGRASFMGISTKASEMATLVAVLIACLLALAFKLLADNLQRRGLIQEPHLSANSDVAPAGPFRRFAIPFLVSALLSLLTCPDLLGVAQSMKTALFTPQWDANNFTYWTYLIHLGYLPYRDFWYPYSGLYTFEEQLPWGPLISWCYRVALYSVLFYSFYKLLRRRVSLALFVTLVMLVGDWTWMFPNAYRYLLAIAVFLAYLVIERVRPSPASLTVFWFACGLAFFIEPMQLVSAAAAIAAVVTFDLWQNRSRSVAYWRARALREALVPLVLVSLILFCFALKGQLAGLAQLYLHAGDSAAYGAIPTDISWLKHISLGAIPARLMDYSSLILFGPPLCIGLGLFEKLRRPRVTDHRAEALLGLGVIYLLVLQKDLIRPMAGQFLLYLMLALLVYSAFGNRTRRALDYIASGFALGFIIFVLFQNGQVNVLARCLSGSPTGLAHNIQALTSRSDLLRAANASYFAPQHFARFPEEQQVAARLRALNPGQLTPQVFVMADEAVIYIVVGQTRPVFYASLYNASPIYDQQRLAQWITAAKPQFVVFEPGDPLFDGFQKLVRDPLVFETVVRNYVPQETVGRFEIARRRRAGEPIALAYWRDKLTPATDFGFLASLSSFSHSRACQSSPNAPCAEFLQVRVSDGARSAGRVTIPFEVGGLPFDLTFNIAPRKREYYILLDRFWPWRAGKDGNLTVRVAEEKLQPGVAAAVILRTISKDLLY